MTRLYDLPRPGDPAVRDPAGATASQPTAGEIALAPTIGVLGVQGDVSEHAAALERAGARAVWVRRPADLEGVDGLVLPGGESTTLRRLLDYEGLLEAVRRRGAEGMPMFGTCAGAILLATEVIGAPAPHLSLVPMTVSRNAYGRQRESFAADLQVPALDETPLHAVFIRAPVIEEVGEGVEVLARVGEEIVLAETDRALVATFHPELTADDRLHRRFVAKVRAGSRHFGGQTR
ncbi:MAG TPA: pyridoxal 5'-phosphate synthase glutaminase subunit PdxT [Gemmatimonadota bacterium]|nr:pyridoxal 5'-phosphate synthase glutaminase subunit PdxT [Gemmatimonadota bacterium]